MKYNGIHRDIPVFMGFTTLRHARCISIDENIQYISARHGADHSCARQVRMQVVDALRFWRSPRRSAGWLSPV